MDLLEQYKQQHPEAFRQKPKWQPSDEYGFLIRLVMRLSGGRVRDIRQASYVLLAAAIGIGVITVIVLAANFNFLPATRFGEEEAQKQLEEYREIQPF